MSTIPTLPSKAAGQVVTAADLNNIASTCTFLLAKPMTRVHDITGGQSVPTSSGFVNFTTLDFNTDSGTVWAVGNANRMTVQTPGWYKVRYSIQFSSTSTAFTFNTWARGVAGPSNPVVANGVAIGADLYGYVVMNQTTPVTSFAGATGLFPFYLYSGDYIEIRMTANATGGKTGADANMPSSFFAVEFVSA